MNLYRGSSAIPSPLKTVKKSFLPAPSSSQNSKSVLEKLRPQHPHHQGPHASGGQLLQPPPLREVRKGLGKRTSSSSGFSSARSIGSESSVSLSSDTNFPSPSALRRINEGQPTQVTPSPCAQPPSPASTTSVAASNSPKQAKKTIQSRLASPKRSPKLQRGREIFQLRIFSFLHINTFFKCGSFVFHKVC